MILAAEKKEILSESPTKSLGERREKCKAVRKKVKLQVKGGEEGNKKESPLYLFWEPHKFSGTNKFVRGWTIAPVLLFAPLAVSYILSKAAAVTLAAAV